MRSVDPTYHLIDDYLRSRRPDSAAPALQGASGGLDALTAPPYRRARPLHPNVVESVRTRFGLTLDEIQRAGGGVEADIWRVSGDGMSPMCVKRFRCSDRGVLTRMELSEELRQVGLPFPQAYPCVQGRLASTCSRRWVAITEWVDGTPLDTFTQRAAANAGAILARLHRSLRSFNAVDAGWRPAWETPEALSRARETCMRLRRAIEQTRQPTFLDSAIHDALEERSAQLDLVDALRGDLPPMAPQLLHGDFTRPNLLFRGDEVIAVLDLQGRTGYSTMEIGKLAFEPETLVYRPDGMDVAFHALSAYGEEIGDPTRVVGAARTTILANLLSFWGISSRYLGDGGLAPTGGEAYWLNRHTVSQMLLAALPDVESRLG